MKFKIVHEIKGRMRVRFACGRMSLKEADILQYYLLNQESVTAVKVYERNQDAAICYDGTREEIIRILKWFSFHDPAVPEHVWQNSGRETSQRYWDKIVRKVVLRIGSKLFLPVPARNVIVIGKSVRYIWKGIRALGKGKVDVSVLDGTAIAVSLLRGNINTAGAVMFLLDIGEILEEWTHKKSVDDLARSMSLNISKVWLLKDGREVPVDTDQVKQGDSIVIRMGSVIPFDGVVTKGSGEVSQASLTGEALPVPKEAGGYVYAGTVLEAGGLIVQVKETSGSNKYEKIVRMIEESERLKSSMEGNALQIADKLVPYTLFGAALVYLLTGNASKALSVLMVDFSCALKLSIPIAVLSAIREAGTYQITVKGGKYLERIAEADTIVFDKTGTVTKAHPVVAKIVPFVSESEDGLLGLAACLEEHFPHSMARAVVQAAMERGIVHEEGTLK